MPRKRKTAGPGSVDLLWRKLEEDYTARVRQEGKPEYREEAIFALQRLRRSGVWTGPMVKNLRAVFESIW